MHLYGQRTCQTVTEPVLLRFVWPRCFRPNCNICTPVAAFHVKERMQKIRDNQLVSLLWNVVIFDVSKRTWCYLFYTVFSTWTFVWWCYKLFIVQEKLFSTIEIYLNKWLIIEMKIKVCIVSMEARVMDMFFLILQQYTALSEIKVSHTSSSALECMRMGTVPMLFYTFELKC